MRILVRAISYGSIVLHHHNPVTKRVGKIRAGAMPDAHRRGCAPFGHKIFVGDLLRHDMAAMFKLLFDGCNDFHQTLVFTCE